MELSFERLGVSIFLLGAFFLSTKILTGVWRRKARLASGRDSARVNLRAGVPTLLYFWTDACAQCPGQEQEIERAVRSLDGSGKRVEVKKINALENESLARSMSVMTVPTTILFDARGDVAAWNAGLTTAKELVLQLKHAA